MRFYKLTKEKKIKKPKRKTEHYTFKNELLQIQI